MGWASRYRRSLGQRPAPERGTRRRVPKDDLRISERLVDIIAPYREDGLGLHEYRALIGAAATAWNMTLLPENERGPALQGALRDIRVVNAEEPVRLITALIQRKEQLFPDDHRAIVDWEVWESDGQIRVNAASTLPD